MLTGLVVTAIWLGRAAADVVVWEGNPVGNGRPALVVRLFSPSALAAAELLISEIRPPQTHNCAEQYDVSH